MLMVPHGLDQEYMLLTNIALNLVSISKIIHYITIVLHIIVLCSQKNLNINTTEYYCISKNLTLHIIILVGYKKHRTSNYAFDKYL